MNVQVGHSVDLSLRLGSQTERLVSMGECEHWRTCGDTQILMRAELPKHRLRRLHANHQRRYKRPLLGLLKKFAEIGCATRNLAVTSPHTAAPKARVKLRLERACDKRMQTARSVRCRPHEHKEDDASQTARVSRYDQSLPTAHGFVSSTSCSIKPVFAANGMQAPRVHCQPPPTALNIAIRLAAISPSACASWSCWTSSSDCKR
jgi:hypothetical protein